MPVRICNAGSNLKNVKKRESFKRIGFSLVNYVNTHSKIKCISYETKLDEMGMGLVRHPRNDFL